MHNQCQYYSPSMLLPSSAPLMQDLFWAKYGGSWPAAYARWSTATDIPPEDRSAWADSCPAMPVSDGGVHVHVCTRACTYAVHVCMPCMCVHVHVCMYVCV